MTREQWEMVKAIFGEALDRAPVERASYIRAAAQGQPDLLAELLRLLKESERESDLLSRPVLANARALSQEEAPRFAPATFLARRFRIVRFIARGGMGEVYEAEDVELGERVALKAIRQRVAANTDLRSLFKREIQLARRVTHPNVCRIFDLAQHEDPQSGEPVHLLSMELIDGQSLTEYLRTNGPLTYASALPLIEDIAAGLQAIHDAGIIHGDLKPGNVMLAMRPGETAPHARVMDFGMAIPTGQSAGSVGHSEAETVTGGNPLGDNQPTVTLRSLGPGLVGGTPDYFAPEQARGATATTATDVYAFALVIGEILGVPRSGRLKPDHEKMPSRWSRILRRCLDRDPAKRYSRPSEVADALRSALQGRARSRRMIIAGACALLTIVMAAKRIDTLLRGTANGLILTESLSQSVEAPSPDGRFLAGTAWDTGDLILRETGNGRIRRLTHKTTSFDAQYGGAFSGRFSLDGRNVVYTWAADRRKADIRLIGTDGKGERTLYHAADNTWPTLLDCSPDGRRVLFRLLHTDFNPTQLGLISLEDGTVRFLDKPAPDAQVMFDADGRGLIYDVKTGENGPSEVRHLSADGTESTLIGRTGSNNAIGWSPDRRRLIFSSDRRGQPGIWTAQVSAQGAEGEPRELVPSSKGWQPLGISRSGALFYRQDASTIDVYTAVLDLASGRTVSSPQRVTERFIGAYASPNWSEDGRQLVFNSTREVPAAALAIYQPETGQIRDLRLGLAMVNRPQWVEHGTAIMVTGKPAKGPRGLYRIDARTGAATLFRSASELQTTLEGVWSRDGRLHFNRFQDPRRGLFRLNLETGERRVLYLPPPGIAMGLENLALSPDGRMLAFHVHSDAAATSSLMLIPSDGGAATPLYTVHAPQHFLYGSFTWTPDSRSVLVASSREIDHPPAEQRISELWRVPVDGGARARIEFPAMGVVCLRLSSDGKTIAFHSRREKSEIWVLQNFL